MQVSLTDHVSWPWWLAAAFAALTMTMWWQPWADDAAAPVPAPATVPAIVAATAVSSTVPASTAVAPPPKLKFVGAVLAGAGSFATVRRATDSQMLELRMGDRVDGYAVTAIEPERVVLAGAAQSIVIEADRTAPEPAPRVLPAAIGVPAAPPAEPPKWADGEAPWDLAPPFKH